MMPPTETSSPTPYSTVGGGWHRLRRRLSNAAFRSSFELSWFFPALLLLGIGRAAVLLVPFRKMASTMGRYQGPCVWIPLLTSEQSQRADQIGCSVRLAARYTPWTANCFPQALAASTMLRLYRVPYTLHFGLCHDPDSREMKAHAWISAGPVKVTGGTSFHQFAVVGTFYYDGTR